MTVEVIEVKDANGVSQRVAVDKVGTDNVQIVKAAFGADDTFTLVTSSTGMPVSDAGGSLTVDGTVTANLAAGTNAIGKLAANSGVDIGDVDVTSVTPGTAAGNLGKAEDAAHASGDTGVMVLGVRNDAGTALATTTGDYIPLSMDANGYLRVNVVAGSTSGTEYTEGATDATISGTAFLWEDASDTLRPVSAAKPLPTEIVAGTVTLSGEDHIGEVGGNSTSVAPTVTVSTSAYTAGDVLGGEIALTNALRVVNGSAVLQDILITDVANQKAALTILIFNANPAATSADNAAFAWGSGDQARLAAKINVAAADYETIASQAVAHIQNLGIVIKGNDSSTSLYAFILTTGTPTYAATTNFGIRFKFLRD